MPDRRYRVCTRCFILLYTAVCSLSQVCMYCCIPVYCILLSSQCCCMLTILSCVHCCLLAILSRMYRMLDRRYRVCTECYVLLCTAVCSPGTEDRGLPCRSRSVLLAPPVSCATFLAAYRFDAFLLCRSFRLLLAPALSCGLFSLPV